MTWVKDTRNWCETTRDSILSGGIHTASERSSMKDDDDMMVMMLTARARIGICAPGMFPAPWSTMYE